MTHDLINVQTIRIHPIPAPTPYVNTDVQVDLSEFMKAARAQTATTYLARTVSTPSVVTGPDIDTTESDRKAAIERAKVDVAQHDKNVKAARSFKNGE